MSNLINKVKDALSSDKSSDSQTTHTGTHTGPTGTHTGPTGTHTGPAGTHTGPTGTTAGTHAQGDTFGAAGDNRGLDGPAPKTDGPHKSDMMNKLDPRVDSDRDHSKNMGANPHGDASIGQQTTTAHNTHTTSTTHGTHGGVGGVGGVSGSHSAGAPEGVTGPHNSRAMNAADPRVDSDRDGSRTVGGGSTTAHNTHGTHATHSTHAGTGVGSGIGGTHTTGTHASGTEGNHGPHSNKMMNTLDPRVDSDRDGSRTVGGSQTTTHNTHGTHTGTGVGTGIGGTHTAGTHTTGTHTTGTHTSGTEGNHGPHSNKMMNTLDPRVDSDRDGSRTVGGSQTTTHNTHGTHTGTGVAGTHSSGAPEGAYGAHNSRAMNAADPRIDSDRDGSRTVGGGSTTAHNTHGTHAGGVTGATGTHAPGPAPNTAGPHKSDFMNKADPRVDSNLDGSKTMGGDKTYAGNTTTGAAPRDPTDSTQVPPSVMQQHIGKPSVEHGDAGHDRERRHSAANRETHHGL